MNPERKQRLKNFLEERRLWIEDALSSQCEVPWEEVPPRLQEAMVYSLRAGGKRIRPVLCLAAAERCGLAPRRAMPLALAHEWIHTASLIHDDLPCMDDDDLRRGKPTNHRVFGEALALLAGDALLAWAFEFALAGLVRAELPSDRILEALRVFAEAVGPRGICGGQVRDTDVRSQSEDPEDVWLIARTKTAVLLRSALTGGAILAGAEPQAVQAYRDYGTHLGTAFQIVDDILDVSGDSATLGKTAGKDAAQGKRTFVSVYGLSRARELAEQESCLARTALVPVCGEDHPLLDLVTSLVERTR